MEPQQAPHIPEPPYYLSGYAIDEWCLVAGELYRLGLLTVVDTAALAAYCQAFNKWRLAEEALKKMADRDPVMHGFVIKRLNGEAAHNPLVSQARRAAQDMLRLSAEFGFTPAARARIAMGVGVGGPIDAKFGDLLA